MSEARGDPVHNPRVQVLQLGFNHERRGCRGYREGEREGHANRVDEHEPELGSKLAVKRRVGGAGTVI